MHVPTPELRAAVRRFLRRFGVDVVRYDARRFPELRRAQLLRERAVTVLVDAGANDGTFAAQARLGGYRDRIVSVEPQSVAFAALERRAAGDAGWRCIRAAAGSRRGTATLNLSANSSSSSLLPIRERHVSGEPDSRYVGTETVPVVTLDDLRQELLTLADRVYLKVDVQGFELEVLRGAEQTLRQVVAAEIELSLEPLYDGAPLFPDVVAHLAERGFALIALEEVFSNPVDGTLLQLDGTFVRVP